MNIFKSIAINHLLASAGALLNCTQPFSIMTYISMGSDTEGDDYACCIASKYYLIAQKLLLLQCVKLLHVFGIPIPDDCLTPFKTSFNLPDLKDCSVIMSTDKEDWKLGVGLPDSKLLYELLLKVAGITLLYEKSYKGSELGYAPFCDESIRKLDLPISIPNELLSNLLNEFEEEIGYDDFKIFLFSMEHLHDPEDIEAIFDNAFCESMIGYDKKSNCCIAIVAENAFRYNYGGGYPIGMDEAVDITSMSIFSLAMAIALRYMEPLLLPLLD